MMVKKRCSVCLIEYEATCNASKYCKECSEYVKKKRANKYNKFYSVDKFVMAKCHRCGVSLKVRKTGLRYCDACKIKIYQERQAKERELRRKFKIAKMKYKSCEICGEKFFGNCNKRYCDACGIEVTRQRIVKSGKAKDMKWENLAEEEKLRRMDIVSLKLLNEENNDK